MHESTPAPNEAHRVGSVSKGANAQNLSLSPRSNGAGVARFRLVLEEKLEHRTPHRPTLWIHIGENETSDPAIFIHLEALHGQQERIIELSEHEANRLAWMFKACTDEIDEHRQAARGG